MAEIVDSTTFLK